MSLTVVQRFYELAKQEAEAPALGVTNGEEFHSLPWWFVKSKAKHFGLGLLEAQAREGEYFYLLSSAQPAWIYAELGALTMGLRTLPLPRETPLERVEDLFRRYPPAFYFLEAGDWPRFRPLLGKIKGLRRIITPEEAPDLGRDSAGLAASFRQVFNQGIRSEAKHHASYRRIRQSLGEDREMSPLRVAPDGSWEERPLRFGEVNEVCARISHAMGPGKARRVLSTPDLSRSFARVACLYWPIFAGLQSLLLPAGTDWAAALRRFRPEAAFLRQADAELLERLCAGGESPQRLGFFRRRALRARLGKRLRCLIGESPFSPSLEKLVGALGLRLLTANPSAANFLL